MPKVLRIINRLNLGGPTYNVANLTKYMSSEYETLLLAGMKDEDEESSEYIIENLGLKPLYIKEMYREINPIKDYKSYQKIREIIAEFKPDIVHTHAAKAGAIGRLAAIHAKVPVILHTFHGHVFHSYFGALKTRAFLEIERYLAKKTSAVVAISEIQKNELVQQYKIAPENKFQVVPLGFDLQAFYTNSVEKREKFRRENQIEEDEIAIGIIGRLVPVKNHELFLEVVNIVLKKTTKKVRFFIFGDGELMSMLQEKAKILGIAFDNPSENSKNPLKFYSWIKEADIAMAGMDLIALTSRNEGTPVTLIEAQASSKPFVTTDVGGIRDIVLNGETGFVVPPNNETLFAESLLKLIENEDFRKQFSEKGKTFATEQFGHLRLAQDMEALYSQLLKNPRF